MTCAKCFSSLLNAILGHRHHRSGQSYLNIETEPPTEPRDSGDCHLYYFFFKSFLEKKFNREADNYMGYYFFFISNECTERNNIPQAHHRPDKCDREHKSASSGC